MIELTRYRLLILAGYLILVPLLVLYAPLPLNFEVSTSDIWPFVIALFSSITAFFIINKIYGNRSLQYRKISLFSSIKIVFYAMAFSIPEEIIFRGIIQGYLGLFIVPMFAITCSALVFAVAHLPNGASGYRLHQLHWRFAVVTFLLGLALGWLYFITQSLTMPILLHALYIVLYKIFYHTSVAT